MSRLSEQNPRARVGIFGGSGFYSFLSGETREIKVETPYGSPSDTVVLSDVGGVDVAFLPRHGRSHSIPPHEINYRANVWAMRSLGVEALIGPNACGSLQEPVKPGDIVVCDQFVDRTKRRIDTFYDGPVVTHVSAAEPYCPILRKHAVDVCRRLGVAVHDGGTVVVIEGPRFSTKSESKFYTRMGWEVINMTQYPECWLARELQIPYVNLSMITDYDAGLVGDGHEAVTNDAVLAVFNQNLEKLRRVLFEMIRTLPDTTTSPARSALDGARFA